MKFERVDSAESRERGSVPGLPEAQIRILRGELRSGDFERGPIELEAQIGEGEAGPIVQDRMLAIPSSNNRPPIGGQALGEMDRGNGNMVESFPGTGIKMEAGILFIYEDLKFA